MCCPHLVHACTVACSAVPCAQATERGRLDRKYKSKVAGLAGQHKLLQDELLAERVDSEKIRMLCAALEDERCAHAKQNVGPHMQPTTRTGTGTHGFGCT